VRALELKEEGSASTIEEQIVYIEELEREVQRMVGMFKRLALEENCQSAAGIASQQNPVQAMQMLRLKARNEVARDTYQQVSTVIVRETARDKIT
jgi:hypothetical protein